MRFELSNYHHINRQKQYTGCKQNVSTVHLWNPVKQVTYVVAVGLAGKKSAVNVQSRETAGTSFNVLLETFPRKLTIIVSDDTLIWLYPGYQWLLACSYHAR